MTEKEGSIFWELVGKRIAGEITDEENYELNGLLTTYPELLYSLETLGTYWNASKENITHQDREAALEKHMLRMKNMKLLPVNEPITDPDVRDVYPRNRRYFRWIAAAAVLVVVSLGIMFSKSNNEDLIMVSGKPYMKTITALKGSRNHIILPDGSSVWLNAGTTISYLADSTKIAMGTGSVNPLPAWFSKDKREIYLTGEAYFEISHNKNRDFLIHTSRIDIRDLGTAFNVKAYPSDSVTEATLVEGSIQVNLKNSKDVTTLTKPHQKITVRAVRSREKVNVVTGIAYPADEKADIKTSQDAGSSVLDKQDTILQETAWLKGMMIFRNESFEELAARMERWYNVSIDFDKISDRYYRFSGTFHEETIDQALKELQLIKPFSFTIDSTTIHIK